MGKLYSVVDIETTGLSPEREKITEIAIILHDGNQIIEEFSSLINPEVEIPWRITQLTGINNRMVSDAPKFYEVARHIVELTEGTTLVGHNVHFDYNFIRKEFRELGYDFQRKRICTAKLSRKLLPGRRSYSLGKLCQELGIENPARHRAYGDASATARLFEILLRVGEDIEKMTFRGLNARLKPEQIKALPHEPGVYYFHDDEGKIIYIGKSKNIYERVMTHMTNHTSRRAIEMRNQTASVSYELTGNELIALLLESDEIKRYLPKYNRALKRKRNSWGLFSYVDEQGYEQLRVMRLQPGDDPLTSFNSAQAARNHLYTLAEAFNLCQKLCGLYDSKGACFQYSIHQCNGACIGKEPAELYNRRVHQALIPYRHDQGSYFLLGKGRTDSERSVVMIEKGVYRGFGFIDLSLDIEPAPDELSAVIEPREDNADIRQILRSYLSKNGRMKRIPFEKFG